MCHRPWTAVIFVVALLVALPLTDLPRTVVDDVRHILVLALIVTGAWLCVKLLFAFEEIAFRQGRGDRSGGWVAGLRSLRAHRR
jgi:hypothetical protein